jgi:hypothetical protein
MCSSAPAAPSTQTSTTDLPDWAKPYAKETLAKTKALTDINANPYQQYGGERIAGFQPMQEQAFKTMSGLDAGPEAFSKGIGSYMSPYMQNVVDIQKREAGRQSDIAGTQQQAQATQAGAFGGGRDAIMRAERERNLSQQMGDIQAKGSQAAFDQASNQFRQGITQESGLAQMQGQMGQQQQQQAQRPLDTAYQDFLNQQNYPYKQLGFMSDMVNKLPLGQKSTSQVYEAPGSTMGQLAGLGMGAYGVSKMLGAEGGLMQSYADGGVTGPQNVESILAKLSDAQLQQAHEAALNRRDVNEAQMIEAVMAQRASMRQGTEQMPQGIAPALPEQFADGMEQSMATGGIVAFADRGAVVDPDELTASDYQALRPEAKSTLQSIQDFLTPKAALENRQRYEQSKAANEKANAPAPQQTAPAPAAPAPSAQAAAAPQKPAAKPLDRQYADITPAPKPSKAQVKSAVEQLAEQQGLNPEIKDDLMANALKIRKELGAENQPIIDEMKKMIEGQKPDIEAMKSQGLNQGLAEFGFKMAANAARPNARFLESASSAAPALSAASAKTQELVTAAQQNYAKLRMDQAKYETALQKNDMQTAATMSASIRQGQQQDKLLQFHIADAKDKLALEQQKLASQNAYQQGILAKQPDTVRDLTKDIMRQTGLPYDQALERAGNILKPGAFAATTRADASTKIALAKEIDAVEKNYPAMMRSGSSKFAQDNQRAYEAAINRVYSTYGASPQGAAPSGGGSVMKFDSQGNPI